MFVAIAGWLDSSTTIISIVGAVIAAMLRSVAPLLRLIQTWNDMRRLKFEAEIDPAGIVRVTGLTEQQESVTIRKIEIVRDESVGWSLVRTATGLDLFTHLRVVEIHWHTTVPKSLSASTEISLTGAVQGLHKLQELRQKWIRPTMLRVGVGASTLLKKVRVVKCHIATPEDKFVTPAVATVPTSPTTST